MPESAPCYQLPEPYSFKRGGELDHVELVHETWGELNRDRSNALLLFTGLSPGAHAASSDSNPKPGWWEDMIGAGKAIDTDRFFVVCINSLGSCWGSTGPSSTNPATGEPYRLDFPELSIDDIAITARHVIDHLGIDQLAAVVGPSMGGMTAMAWLREFPDRARHLLLISTAAHAEPFATAIRSLQREAIVSDEHWHQGEYTEDDWPETGMRLARKIGMLSYRSPDEWRSRFGRQRQDRYPSTVFGMEFEVESYLEAAARRFIRGFDPACYVYLSRAMDWFEAAPPGLSLQAMFERTSLQTACVIGTRSDILFPIHQQRELADALASAGIDSRFEALDSIQGHDAFLVDFDRFVPAVSGYLSDIELNP